MVEVWIAVSDEDLDVLGKGCPVHPGNKCPDVVICAALQEVRVSSGETHGARVLVWHVDAVEWIRARLPGAR